MTLITTIAGQPITTAGSGITIANTTLRPGNASSPINGTLKSLTTASQSVVGSHRHLFESESAGFKNSTVGVSGATGSSATIMPSINQSHPAAGSNGSAMSTSVQEFKGGGKSLRPNVLWMKVFVVIIAVFVAFHGS